ncbi:hypothetical protein BDN72DRAFT_603502 [Pluteus cervinus]|uniref:Uncharacterized protein n=1 Tax=Pluteus cervinus TaxID=181527 RepID=A0ACD3BDB9_9AGAR|nr:hypothetical protein BDN72DRAFT_603502 [Pluteus cervinus]
MGREATLKSASSASLGELPLSKRPLDMLYFAFLLMHIPATLLTDLYSIYPESIARILRPLNEQYFKMSNDPLVGALAGYHGPTASDHLLWFKTYIWLEVFVQLPIFAIGAWGLYKSSRLTHVLLLAYATLTCTTTLPCVVILFKLPAFTGQQVAQYPPAVTDAQRLILASSYVSFFMIPFVMLLDMFNRVMNLVQVGIKATSEAKSK